MLGKAFDTRPNALNAVRLVLAATVIVWHAVEFPSTQPHETPIWQALEMWPVDGFFAISGFLIVRSWDRRPEPVAFLRARAARLLPGLWLCLILTAFVIAPLVAADQMGLLDQLRYVAGNAGVRMTQRAIGDSLPTENGWNTSLWTLWWESLCYLGVLGLGLAGALRVRLVAGLAIFFWAWMVVDTTTGMWLAIPSIFWMVSLPRLAFMFTLGALAYLERDRIPMSGRLAGVAAVVLAISWATPNYHLLGGPALAYLLLWGGIELGTFRRLRLDTDLSYGVYVYGAPVLFALMAAGASTTWWQLGLLNMAIVFPLAALSWFLVERPALRWARGRGRVKPEPSRALVQGIT